VVPAPPPVTVRAPVEVSIVPARVPLSPASCVVFLPYRVGDEIAPLVTVCDVTVLSPTFNDSVNVNASPALVRPNAVLGVDLVAAAFDVPPVNPKPAPLMLVPPTAYELPILSVCTAAPCTVNWTESVILDVISPAKTGVVRNNEKANRSLFIFLFYRTESIYEILWYNINTNELYSKL
jgi:hypothetical protein